MEHQSTISDLQTSLMRAQEEIERLQEELTLAQKWRDNFKLAFEKERKNTEYWYEKAVTGEQR